MEIKMKNKMIKHVVKITFVLICTMNISLVSASDTSHLKPFIAKYKAFRNGNELGHALMTLEKLDDHYKLYYESDVSIFFLSDRRTETSLFKVSKGEFQQLEYNYVREGTGRDKYLNLKFDSQNNRILIDGENDINWQKEWDNQLYRFDLQRKLRTAEQNISYNLINYRGQLKTYGFEVVGEEVLDLPFGKLNTIKVKTIRSSKRRETFSWFAPDLDYQLVRLRQLKEGDEQGDIKLSEYTVED